jgi:two-component system capsular synthesis response regulator RcsB
MAIRILVADDADLTLLGARMVLEEDRRYQVVGTARALGDLVEQAAQQPDLILFNEWFYNVDILTAVERIQRAAPGARLIVMGVLADGLLIRDLFHAGVKGYLYKSDDLQTCLPQAVDTVMRGRPYLSPTANSEYLVAMQSPGRDWHLDPQSRAVLRLLAQGLHVGEIAKKLDIPLRRVYWLRQKLRKRFNASTNEHLVLRAVAEGFARPAE